MIEQEGVDENFIEIETGNCCMHYLAHIEGYDKKKQTGGLTAVQKQMVQKKLDIMNYIVGRGKIIHDSINNEEDAPLHYAANSFNKRASLILIFNGADPTK